LPFPWSVSISLILLPLAILCRLLWMVRDIMEVHYIQQS
jgi:hypothetical protein